ncbi:MAG TPA: methyltransferase [Alphaproteobacteria bacterium]|nr:methyltransferase [Alphaproteobacteria bacterium]
MTFTLLGGRLRMAGKPPAEDALWLSASVAPVMRGCRILDAGAGAGVAGLALCCRLPGTFVTGIELQHDLTAQANENAKLNGFETYHCEAGDILQFAPARKFDGVICNPPFHAAARGHHSADPAKQLAHHQPDDLLERWVAHLASLTDGPLHLMVHAANEDELKPLAAWLKWGAVVTPLATTASRPPKRLLVVLAPAAQPVWQVNAPLAAYDPAIRKAVLTDGLALSEL